MATRVLSFNYVLKQNKNDDSTAFGKYFAEAYSPNSALSLKGLVSRVAMDQSIFTEEIAKGVIDKLTVDMVELLQSGTSVKWDGLGTFRPNVESAGVSDPTDYNLNTDVKGIHIRFIPVNDKGEELTSRKFAETLTFNRYGLKTAQKVTTTTGRSAYKGNIQVAAAVAMQRSLPILNTVDGESGVTVLRASGSTLAFSGSRAGVTYTVIRDGVALGSVQSTSDGPITITLDAAAADATRRETTVAWSYRGKDHSIVIGSFTIEE